MIVGKVYWPDFEKGHGVVDAVVQDINGHLLSVTKVTEAQWRDTLEGGCVTFGNLGRGSDLVDMRIDCDGDALLCHVRQGRSDVWTTWGEPDFDAAPNGLLPVVAQVKADREVVMLAYTGRAEWEETRCTGLATYFSRSRGGRWVKGETSDNMQKVFEGLVGSGRDNMVYCVEQLGHGVACHLNARSCFFRSIIAQEGEYLMDVPLSLDTKARLKRTDAALHENLIQKTAA